MAPPDHLANSLPLRPDEPFSDFEDGDISGPQGPIRTSVIDGPSPNIFLPSRPHFQRDQVPPQPLTHPPAPPQQQQHHQDQIGMNADSLSLAQLRRIVTEMPRVEPTAYAFTYEDTASFPEEIEEWFPYTEDDHHALLRAKITFEEKWKAFGPIESTKEHEPLLWTAASNGQRLKFVTKEVAGLENPVIRNREACLGALMYVGLGAWDETAGLKSIADTQVQPPNRGTLNEDTLECQPDATSMQLDWMMTGAEVIYESMGIQAIFDVLRGACLREGPNPPITKASETGILSAEELEFFELKYSLSLMYFIVEAGRRQVNEGRPSTIRDEIATLDPDYLIFLVKLLARLRWDDSAYLPLTKILLLFWKSILLLFGGTKELDQAKIALSEPTDPSLADHAIITASPLDYHLFRQEITSKYPAYNPPPPLLPLELENNSILPPLPNHPSKYGTSGIYSGIGPANVNGNGGSILHQPVHIATPAPSPPPSPAGPGGKAGKKQNYQTNQNFPFLYPPLDGSSNSAGGKGSAGLQETLVGKKWEGSDIPASILEAGKLFASRMRMTRAMRQLWEERELFMKFERGWGGLGNISSLSPSRANQIDDKQNSPATETKEDLRWESLRRMEIVEDFYRNALPHLQSLVIVLMKVILASVTALITQPTNGGGFYPNPLAPGLQAQENGNINGSGVGGQGNQNGLTNFSPDLPLAELETLRSREITAKALSGLLITLLKWFKLSHVLKYEYLTQLLLDSNYLPLILKLFSHQELENIVNVKLDRQDLSFFSFCLANSKQRKPNASQEQGDAQESDDEACPPPIVKLQRDTTELRFSKTTGKYADLCLDPSPPPESDELCYPASKLPMEPITHFSWRNFFSHINYLRIMQKICKDKAHRNLLLVQYKSSTILKKCLKVPQPELRLYTLKLFKNQVPYCGRKWRQSNMRVITAVYLYCKPQLRDDWLAGSDVDGEVEEALPLEQALRALTHWYNLKRYPESMGIEVGVLDREQDFFVRELGRMEIGEDHGAEDGHGDLAAWEGPLHLDAY
ncbi:MAG: Factor arrest protein 11 [Trizodia sp. TS-e1964]|nr:MAG: Factor arrest protein 11 [Trizodia sp. TS-e1964]